MKLPVPNVRARPAYRLNWPTLKNGLQGSATEAGALGTITSGQTYREVVAVPNAVSVRVRILTAGGAAGTLNVKPVAPVGLLSTDESVVDKTGFIDPAKVTAYTTGIGTAAVVSATEQKVDLALQGESFVLVEFVASGTGTLVWCDVSQLVYT
jgi:hypothetical protein